MGKKYREGYRKWSGKGKLRWVKERKGREKVNRIEIVERRKKKREERRKKKSEERRKKEREERESDWERENRKERGESDMRKYNIWEREKV
jgi:hypothetical protein